MPRRRPVPPVVLPNAETWDMTSKFTGRTYRIYVARPVTAEAEHHPRKVIRCFISQTAISTSTPPPMR